MEYLQAALLIAGGIVVLASLAKRHVDALLPVQGCFALALFVTGVSWLIRGPLALLQGPPLLVVVFGGLGYGAVLAGVCLAFPHRAPKPLQLIAGAFTVVAGTLLLLLSLRVIKPI